MGCSHSIIRLLHDWTFPSFNYTSRGINILHIFRFTQYICIAAHPYLGGPYCITGSRPSIPTCGSNKGHGSGREWKQYVSDGSQKKHDRGEREEKFCHLVWRWLIEKNRNMGEHAMHGWLEITLLRYPNASVHANLVRTHHTRDGKKKDTFYPLAQE